MLSFKQIEVCDIPELAKIYVETFNAEPWNDKWTIETASKRLHQMINVEDFHGIYAIEGNTICGMILGCMEQFYNGMTFNIREFCVRNGMRGKGIGTVIFKHFESELRDLGVKELILFTSRGDYTEHFYHKQDLKNIEDLVLMEKSI